MWWGWGRRDKRGNPKQLQQQHHHAVNAISHCDLRGRHDSSHASGDGGSGLCRKNHRAKRTGTSVGLPYTRAHTHKHTHTHTHSHTLTHTHSHTLTHTQPHTQTHTLS